MAHNDSFKRAATVLTIAQHKFKQALKKEDREAHLPSVDPELTSLFLVDVDAVLKQNTAVNIQKCTGWIAKHISPSKIRIVSLGEYLVSVAKSTVVDEQAAAVATARKRAARRRLALLLIINDVLHTDKFHQRSTASNGMFGKESVAYLPELVDLAASYMFVKGSQAERSLRALLNYWAVNRLVEVEAFKALRDRAEESLIIAQGGTPVRKRNYLLPEYHGDRNAPWYDLPASYMLEPMISHRNRPIDPSRIKIAKLNKKPVSSHVRGLLDNYFENIDLKYTPTGDNPTGESKKYKLSLDPMGQLVKQDKETNEATTICNGYGWSLKLCQDMQRDGVPEAIKKAREEVQREDELRAGRDHRRGASPPDRRQRSSSASSYTRERGRRGRNHSRRSSRSSYDSRSSHSRSRERSRDHRRPSSRHERRSDDHGRRQDHGMRDQPRPPPRPAGKNSSNSGPPSDALYNPNRSNSNDLNAGRHAPSQHGFDHNSAQPPQVPFNAPPFPHPIPMPHQYPGNFPMQHFPPPPPPPQFQPGAFPGGVPPPPPPNYSGPFPPPLPNMTAMANTNNPYNFVGNQYSNTYGNNAGYGQNQGNFQGGRGGFRGNYQGGNSNRGGHGSPQREQRGGRW